MAHGVEWIPQTGAAQADSRGAHTIWHGENVKLEPQSIDICAYLSSSGIVHTANEEIVKAYCGWPSRLCSMFSKSTQNQLHVVPAITARSDHQALKGGLNTSM